MVKQVTQQDIADALDKAGSNGITSDWFGDELQLATCNLLTKMRKAGEAHAIRAPGKGGARRWFKTEAMAQEYTQRKRAEIAPRVRKTAALYPAQPFKADAVVVWPAHIKVQQCPGPKLGLRSDTHGEHG